jgi:drug/metabolite transporter (DMT)-like permease
MQVSYGLALFQLSALISVIFGWKYFNEKNILQKLLGSTIMIIGAAILIIS